MFALMPIAAGGYQIIRVDYLKAKAIAFLTDEALGERIVELLHRHGLEDADLSALEPTGG